MRNFEKFLYPVFFIAAAAVLRLLPHIPNVAPIAAMALFGGVYLTKKYALAVPLLALFVSDLFLGFHNTMLFVYGSFLLTGLLGLWLKKHKTVGNIFVTALASSVLFYLITNFGVWLVGGLYPKTVQGLILCYSAAIPFFRNSVMGDLFYTGVMFGSLELVAYIVGTRRKELAA